MDLSQLPKPALIIVAFLAGGFLIYLLRPPASVCEPQLEVFRNRQSIFTFVHKVKAFDRAAEIREAIQKCREGNNAGACNKLFAGLKILMHDLDTLDLQCKEDVKSITEVRFAIENGLKLFQQIAWGDGPPPLPERKLSWLEPTDIGLYCELKSKYIFLYGKENWGQFKTAVAKTLPGAEGLANEALMEMSLSTIPCQIK